MDQQIPASIPPEMPRLTPEQVEQIKAMAREQAIQQGQTQMAMPNIKRSIPPRQPQIVYMRRNLTVAELLVVMLIACGLVTGFQTLWYYGSRLMPQIEIKVK